MPPCEGPEVSKSRSSAVKGPSFLIQGFKNTAYPFEVVSLKMKITPDVFEAYLKCPTKCWLRATNEPSAGGSYPEWVTVQNDSYQVSERRRLAAKSPDDEVVISPDIMDLEDAMSAARREIGPRSRRRSIKNVEAC
jgi:hypothetical protein